MRAVAHFLLNPLYHFILVLLTAFFLRKWKEKYSCYLFYYATGFFFLAVISPLPYWLTEGRESRFPIFAQREWAQSAGTQLRIMVLGSGHSESPGFPPNSRLSENALSRIAEGVRLHYQFPQSKLICSGYSASGRTPQAVMLAQTALALGVAPQDTFMLPKPANTEAEARAYAARFGTDQPLILVTSALHMPRAMHWFKQMGCNPIAAPTDHLVKPDPDHNQFWFKPSILKLEMTERLLHEYAGMLHAWWKKDE
jgi:uncharacterized SAM-binding protein YcdF (DUF218 family)